MGTTTTHITKWVWCGYPGHFIGAADCQMHLHTRVGDFRVSTVGDYRPPGHTHGPKPIGAGEDSLYETFVFEVAGFGEHGEGTPTTWGEVEARRYATAEEAEAGHMELCRRFAAKAPEPART